VDHTIQKTNYLRERKHSGENFSSSQRPKDRRRCSSSIGKGPVETDPVVRRFSTLQEPMRKVFQFGNS
jgi:hypothetical protein